MNYYCTAMTCILRAGCRLLPFLVLAPLTMCTQMHSYSPEKHSLIRGDRYTIFPPSISHSFIPLSFSFPPMFYSFFPPSTELEFKGRRGMLNSYHMSVDRIIKVPTVSGHLCSNTARSQLYLATIWGNISPESSYYIGVGSSLMHEVWWIKLAWRWKVMEE